LKTEITYLKSVGPKRAEAFNKLGIKFVEDLLSIYPRVYLQKSSIRDLSKHVNKNVVICGTVIDRQPPWKPNHPLRIYIYDMTGTVECLLWGNFFYRQNQFKLKEKFIFWGKVEEDAFERKIKFTYRDHKKFDEGDVEMLKYSLMPVYILPAELKKTWIKPLALTRIIFNAVKKCSDKIEEVLNKQIISDNEIKTHKEALLRTHFPNSLEEVENARQTLAFEELFYLQMIMALKRKASEVTESGIEMKTEGELNKKFLEGLKFELTGAQKKVIGEIHTDMKNSKPMNRLLQGDVGSGKTIVAVSAMIRAIENGYQCAFMCPTEILSEQHNKVLNEYLEPLGIKTTLLLGGQKKKLREELLQDIRAGKSNVIVGTHALFQEAVEYKNLGLVVIDEQHKFGVMQRAKLIQKAGVIRSPHVLVMTATPIPRTLSLTLYGDLDVSVIDELPKNRKSIKTGLRFEKERDKVYSFMKNEVKKGRQVYIVYPIIEESEKLDLKAATVHYEEIKNIFFPELRVGLIHGRMFWYEIDETVSSFKEKKIDILVSTTIIEVGIDIPNATIMIIEEAQRFGLSQLHQLRGRVGRGAEQSYCILMATDNLSEETSSRLQILVDSVDGFKISQKDLEIRGPGEFFGTRQSGELKLSAADLSRDMHLIEKARAAAFNLVAEDPQLRKDENKNIRKNFLENYRDSMDFIKIA
jgi:ATP-dependent DNA helicase RecG